MWITKRDEVVAKAYDEAKPKQFGDLHERMKYLMALIRDQELWKTHHAITDAIYDLETEVKHYVPARPPFGRRAVRRPK